MIKSTGLSLAGVRSEFFDALAKAKTFPWERFAMSLKSTKASEKYRWLGSLPTMREWGTGRIAKGLRTESYDVDNLKYEATIAVDRDEVADDQTGQIQQRIRQLAGAAKKHPGKLLAALLANGATAGYNSYDGVSFFNTAHVSGASGNQDNALTAAAAAATKTVAEIKVALQAAIQKLYEYKDDQGEPINEEITSIDVIVPPSMYYNTREAVGAVIVAQTSNVLSEDNITVRPFGRLTVGTDMFVVDTSDPSVTPFVFQDREPLEFNSLEKDSEQGFTFEQYLYGVRARYNMTYGFWQKINRTRFAN